MIFWVIYNKLSRNLSNICLQLDLNIFFIHFAVKWSKNCRFLLIRFIQPSFGCCGRAWACKDILIKYMWAKYYYLNFSMISVKHDSRRSRCQLLVLGSSIVLTEAAHWESRDCETGMWWNMSITDNCDNQPAECLLACPPH